MTHLKHNLARVDFGSSRPLSSALVLSNSCFVLCETGVSFAFAHVVVVDI